MIAGKKVSAEWSSSEHEKEDIIGMRTFEKGLGKKMLAELITWFLIFASFAISCIYNAFWEDYLTGEVMVDMFMICLGTVMTLLALVPIVWYLLLKHDQRRSNRCKAPTIAVRQDGVFILYHADGKADYTVDKITNVTCSHNAVTFIIIKKSGERYKKSVKHVENSEAAVTRINNILAYNDDRLTLTNYEKAKMFCPYCGSRVLQSEKQCSHCGAEMFLFVDALHPSGATDDQEKA